ncbi:spermatogenesis-associated serine-rich protein 1 [Desmophyllum pertusum]|uniref:Spermatogenesis-associated serine-rich protein 1 n=1 Tax=Desmophyllum pertusum TaxID=174260 RepID=A0A9X0A7R7_9CNID|nr:spermatogenesis-associated serine-rich protein 1 [Desmophyllum pertusum]
MDVPLVNPVIKPYYRDGFGSKSIGEPQWRPHPRNVLSMSDRLDNTAKGGNGLDWVSSIRCPSLEETRQTSYRPQEEAPRHHSTKDSHMLTREQAVQEPSTISAPEMEEKPRHVQPDVVYDTYDDFEMIYMRRPLEISLRMSVGAKKQVFNRRNGMHAASLGDKSYQVPEYSLEFHKQGSTRPVINFGGSLNYVPDTFVPLQDLPFKPRTTFEERQKQKLIREEIDEVKNLDNWRPADLLSPVLQLPGAHG